MRTIFIALLCLLVGSCTSVPAIYNLIDFAEMTPQEAESSPRIVKLRNKAQIEFSNQRTPLPSYSSDGADVFDKWTEGNEYTVSTIPAGTRVKVLAQIFSEDIESQPYIISDRARYLVELPDGRRGTALIPEAVEGMKVRIIATGEEMTIAKVRVENVPGTYGGKGYKKYFYQMEENGEEYKIADLDCRNRHHLPVYLSGTIIFIDDDDLKAIPGMTLQELEEHIAPTFNISHKEGRLVAQFPFINYTKGDDYYSRLEVALSRQDGGLVAESCTLTNLQHPSKFSWLTNAIFNFTNFTYKTSIKKDAGQFAYYAFPRFDSWNSYYLNSFARMALGLVVGFILFSIFFLYIVPKIARSIFYIRPLTNPQVVLISNVVYLIVLIVAIVYFALYDPISIAIVLLIYAFMRSILYNEIELKRCEACHRVDTIQQTDHEVLSESYTTDGVVHHATEDVHVGDVVTTRTSNYTTRTWREPIFRKRRYSFINFFYRKKWKDYYRCEHCGQDYVYNRSESRTDKKRIWQGSVDTPNSIHDLKAEERRRFHIN